MPENTAWETKVKGLLKSELKRRNVTYAGLVGAGAFAMLPGRMVGNFIFG